MKKFFLLSGTGRMKRGEYFLNMLVVFAFQYIANIDNMPWWLSLILGLVSIGWAIYTISARSHDLGYPGWIAWIRLGLQILPLFGEGPEAIARLCCLCLGLVRLFSKGQPRDNEYGPCPYELTGKEMKKPEDGKEEKVEIEEKVEVKEDTKPKKKTTSKSKSKTTKTAKTKKEK